MSKSKVDCRNCEWFTILSYPGGWEYDAHQRRQVYIKPFEVGFCKLLQMRVLTVTRRCRFYSPRDVKKLDEWL